MANKTGIKKVRVAAASLTNPFALSASTGRPDKTVVDAGAYVEALRGDLSITHSSLMVENDRISGDFGLAPPIPEAGYDLNADEYYELKRGQLTITVQSRTLGVPEAGHDFETYPEMPLMIMLKSAGFAADTIADSANWTDELDASGNTDNNYATYNNASAWIGGDLFQAVVSDRATVHNVNFVDSANTLLGISPSWHGVASGADIPNDQDVRTMYTLSPTLENTPANHFRLDYDKMAVYCFGCRPSSVSVTTVGEFTLQFTFTYEVGQIEFDYSATDVLDGTNVKGRVPRPCGKVVQRIDSYMVYSDRLPDECGGNATTDYLVDRAGDLCIQDFTFTITPTVEFVKCSDNLLGLSDVIITNRDYTVETTIEYHNGASNNQNSNPFDGDYLAEARRTYSFAFGPHGAGLGMGLFLGAGFLKESASGRNVDGTYLTQSLMLGADEYYGDNLDAGGDLEDGGVSARAKIKIGFSR